MFTSAGGSGYIGCCPIDGPFEQCGFRTNCIDAADFKNGTLCDSGCLHDTYTLKWYCPPPHLLPAPSPTTNNPQHRIIRPLLRRPHLAHERRSRLLLRQRPHHHHPNPLHLLPRPNRQHLVHHHPLLRHADHLAHLEQRRQRVQRTAANQRLLQFGRYSDVGVRERLW